MVNQAKEVFVKDVCRKWGAGGILGNLRETCLQIPKYNKIEGSLSLDFRITISPSKIIFLYYLCHLIRSGDFWLTSVAQCLSTNL